MNYRAAYLLSRKELSLKHANMSTTTMATTTTLTTVPQHQADSYPEWQSLRLSTNYTHPQTQSPLLSLPGELRNQIYALTLTSSSPITNPTLGRCIRPNHKKIPLLSIPLARTCRLIHAELPTTTLYKENEFRFTRVAHVHAFFSQLPQHLKRLVTAITIDLREADQFTCGSVNGDIVAAEWMHYLTCSDNAHHMGVWCTKLPTLRGDVPHLCSLHLCLNGWQPQYCNGGHAGWKCLQELLRKVKGLDEVILTGHNMDTWRLSSCPKPWSLGLWFPPGRWVMTLEEGLVEFLWGVVREEESGERKVLAWKWSGARLRVEVKVNRDARKAGVSEFVAGRLPEEGETDWEQYHEKLRFCHDHVGLAEF